MNIEEKQKHFSHCKVWIDKDCDCYEAALEQSFILERSVPLISTRKSIKISGFYGTAKELNDMLGIVDQMLKNNV